tara:strand:- start:108 stop:815 length:708 start_codon:yes stop_codon:yes gene_type:complete
MEYLLMPEIWAAFITLTVLEIVLGIDNVILISILADKLPEEQRSLARRVGLVAALITRLMLLSLAFWIAHLDKALFSVWGHDVTWRDAMLILGGLFLLAKGTTEIHSKIEGDEHHVLNKQYAAFSVVIAQIALLDVVFSFDSVVTAIGITSHISVIVAAILISMFIMVLCIEKVSDFIARHPTVKVLALSYMLLIGMTLIGEGVGFHIPKGYLYFAMAFSFFVELLNMAMKRQKK